MNYLLGLFTFCGCLMMVQSRGYTETSNQTESIRNQKALSIFQVVKFPNSICTGSSSYNGTCYTSSECTNLGGTSAGTCASGFGVCCTFVLGCGGSASQNCSYIVQSSATSLTSPCGYTICPCSSNICRIRFDFTTFVIADPVSVTAVAVGGAITAATTLAGTAIGDCTTDSFSITSPGSRGTPTICGFNTGQHMIVDASATCHKANFWIGSATTTSRSWNIKVTQYACGEENLGGPPQCLQYFTGSTGIISSFNFPTTSATVPLTATHLSNQCYQICIRRESGNCYICYTPTISISASPISNSFGLSISAAIAGGASLTDTACTSDYISIPGGTTIALALTTAANLVGTAAFPIGSRVCGRYFNPTTGQVASVSICSRVIPFRMTFKTNADELSVVAASPVANGDEATGEVGVIPSGTVGFSLKFLQGTC